MWGTESLEMAEQSVDFPGGSDGKRIRLQCGRPGFDPCIGKVLWRRERLLTPVFLPGEFQGQRSLAGYSSWGCKESDTTKPLTEGSVNVQNHLGNHFGNTGLKLNICIIISFCLKEILSHVHEK